MPDMMNRRSFIRRSAASTGALLTCSGLLPRDAMAQSPIITPPTIDKLTVRVVVDGAHDLFISGAQVPGVAIQRTRLPSAAQGKTLRAEWGLSLYLESVKGQETKRYLLDFGFTPEVLNENLDILKINVAQLDGLILSHGHYDHVGGLLGFLAAHRATMKPDLKLYTGGEDNFCARFQREADGSYSDFGTIDRRKLRAVRVQPILSEIPLVIDGHGFTTGAIPRTSLERVLPNTFVAYGERDGLGCNLSTYANQHFTDAEKSGQHVQDQHWHEHATCFNLGDRGLVVITSCGHAGIINTLQRALDVTRSRKIYALIGGFHLAPAQDAYLAQVMAELKRFDIDHILPMHCSGANFLAAAKQQMPERLVLCTTGSSFTFTA